jgi:hypothetical protein
MSGSTAWHNSVRARIYFHGIPSDDGVTRCQIEFKKNDYGPVNCAITVRWQNGVFVPEATADHWRRWRSSSGRTTCSSCSCAGSPPKSAT